MNNSENYDDAMSLKENLSKLMGEAGENPNSLAEKTGVNQPTIWRIINGSVRNPKRTTVEKLATFFRVPTDSMYSRETPVYTPPVLSELADEAGKLVDQLPLERQRVVVNFLRIDVEMYRQGHTNGPLLPHVPDTDDDPHHRGP